MAQPKPNEMPKIIALLAAIGVVLIFAAYNLFGGTRPEANPTTPAGSGTVPAITTAQPAPTTPGGSTTGTSGSVTGASDPMVVNAKPGQVRQFDEVLDMEPEGTYPPLGGKARPGAFAKYQPPKETQQVIKPPTTGTGTQIATARLPEMNYNGSGITKPQEYTTLPVPVDNTPQQEITLDGVVTGSDGFAVLTIREPGRQNATIPDQKRFVRLGEMVGNHKIIEITDMGLKLSKADGVWAIGDKRGVTRRNTIVKIAQIAERTSMPTMDAKLPLISTP